MNGPEEFLRMILQTWGGKTLADLRNDAARQFNGTAFSALKTPAGQRIILVVCVTGEHELEKALKAFRLGSQGLPRNWAAERVVDVIMRTIAGGGFGYEDERDTRTGRVTALVLISAEPVSMENLEAALGLRR